MATTTNVPDANYVGSSHVLETGDKIITNFGGSFGSWAMEVTERKDMGGEYEYWYDVKGDWDGAVRYNLWYSFKTSKWMMTNATQTESVLVYKTD